jgi:aryl-alcohol dehydrogenase-like predicted oxidoreductase
MEQRALGKPGLVVSAMGLGCMGMSEFYDPTDEAESLATINDALDRGVTFLDTADMYGRGANEVLLAKILRERRSEVILATKFGNVRTGDPAYRAIDGRPEYVRFACDASLRRLGIDTIDLYYQHRVDPDTPIEETVGAMAELVAQGKVRWLGLSEAAPATIRRACVVHPIAALQTEYSLWSRDPEAQILPTCRDLGVGFVPYSPLGRGFLTGKISGVSDLAPDDFRRISPRFQPGNVERNRDLARSVGEMAAEKGCTAAQLALAWVLAQGSDIVPIPGTKRRAYLRDNIGALDVKLTPADMARLDAIAPVGAAAGERYPEAGMSVVDG